VEAIRAEDPDRLIIADGLDWGTRPCPELRDLHVAQAARGYAPFHLTHYKATWVGDTSWMPEPAWPRRVRNGPPEDAAWLWETAVRPWIEARERGIGVMVGEWGAFNKTPHPVVLAWAEDCLRNWQKAGFGWALWNFRGSFGILDSGRSDVAYDDFEGHQLDRKLLHLLQRY
jgi:endoglucanase